MKKKRWRDMTEQDILELKRNQCVKCHYFSMGPDGKTEVNNTKGLCDYLSMVGHSRGCSPFDCVENGIFKQKGKKKRKVASPIV